MEAILETKNLYKYFKTRGGSVHAVDGVSLRVETGKTLGVVGESGCGKSTLGRTLIRLHRADQGEILFEGQDITRLREYEFNGFRQNMQIIMQDPYASVNPRMSVWGIIADPLIVNRVCRGKEELDRRVTQLMDTVGLARRLTYAYPHELDGGRRQRAVIARAIALNPKFIVCDEPVSALDVSIQAQTLNLLMDLQEQMTLSYLFITHNLAVVKHISHEIAVMYLGKIVEKAPSEELFRNPLHPYTKALLAAIPIPDYHYYQSHQMETIKGEASTAVDPKPGCRFAPRCALARPECLDGEVEEIAVSDSHRVACKRLPA